MRRSFLTHFPSQFHFFKSLTPISNPQSPSLLSIAFRCCFESFSEVWKSESRFRSLSDSRFRRIPCGGGGSMTIPRGFGVLLVCLPLVVLCLPRAGSVPVPSSNCYVIDNSSRLADYTDWIGHPFEYSGKNGKDADLVVSFCKDVESRSQGGYVDFGHYSSLNYFTASTGPVNFFQGFYKGDLAKCEGSFDKMGRNAQVNIVCGKCLHGVCKGDLGCICDVTYDATMCRAFVELAIPCKEGGPRIFKGFTVGFHPRSWEVVYDGLTQQGFEKAHQEYSYGTEQNKVFLYLTALSALSGRVGKPSLQVSPHKGLDIHLSGSGADGVPPSTLSPTIIVVNWRCENAHDTPYEVVISIPIEDYDPVEFTLTKRCEYRQQKEGEAMSGWSTFGVLSCIFIVLSTLLCCGGLMYNVHRGQQRGLDALPGITILSACLETISGPADYRPADDANNESFVNQAAWERASASSEGGQRVSGGTYGSI